MVERWHRSLKQALMSRLSDCAQWCDELPTALLGLRSVGRSDNGVSPAEYVYGQPMRLPGDFYDISDRCIGDDHSFLRQLRENIRKFKPVSSESRNSRTLFIHRDLNKCEFVFVRNDAVRKPLVPPYDGPYRVIKRSNKVFSIQLPNRVSNISIDRLKPAFVLNSELNSQDLQVTKNDLGISKSVETDKDVNQFLNVKDKSVKNCKTKSILITNRGRVIKPPVRFNC